MFLFRYLGLILVQEMGPHWKVFAASGAAVFATLADMVTPADAAWEDKTWKALLLAALVFVVKLLLQQQKEHKVDIKEQQALHKAEAMAREDRMIAAIEAASESSRKLVVLTEEQTNYFKTVTKTVVDERLGGR